MKCCKISQQASGTVPYCTVLYRTVTNGSASSRVPCRMAPHCTLCVAPSHLDPRVQKPLLHPRVQMACIRAPANRSLGGSPGGPRLRSRPSQKFRIPIYHFIFLLNLLLVRSRIPAAKPMRGRSGCAAGPAKMLAAAKRGTFARSPRAL